MEAHTICNSSPRSSDALFVLQRHFKHLGKRHTRRQKDHTHTILKRKEIENTKVFLKYQWYYKLCMLIYVSIEEIYEGGKPRQEKIIRTSWKMSVEVKELDIKWKDSWVENGNSYYAMQRSLSYLLSYTFLHAFPMYDL